MTAATDWLGSSYSTPRYSGTGPDQVDHRTIGPARRLGSMVTQIRAVHGQVGRIDWACWALEIVMQYLHGLETQVGTNVVAAIHDALAIRFDFLNVLQVQCVGGRFDFGIDNLFERVTVTIVYGARRTRSHRRVTSICLTRHSHLKWHGTVLQRDSAHNRGIHITLVRAASLLDILHKRQRECRSAKLGTLIRSHGHVCIIVNGNRGNFAFNALQGRRHGRIPRKRRFRSGIGVVMTLQTLRCIIDFNGKVSF
jgi:hypothetical protein